jgi:hypothetical protein
LDKLLEKFEEDEDVQNVFHNMKWEGCLLILFTVVYVIELYTISLTPLSADWKKVLQ